MYKIYYMNELVQFANEREDALEYVNAAVFAGHARGDYEILDKSDFLEQRTGRGESPSPSSCHMVAP
jgi:hypothetical protein